MTTPPRKSATASQQLVDQLDLHADVAVVELGLLLTRLTRLYALGLDAAMAAHGVTTSEAAVLTVLAREAPTHTLSPTNLHGAVVQSPAGITKTLARLEAAGLIRRIADPDDRRALLVELTPDGLRRAADVMVAATQFQAGLLAELDERSIRSMTRAVRSMLQPLEADLGFRPSG
jgi:DNA-binding MarR family transcriptional regulator